MTSPRRTDRAAKGPAGVSLLESRVGVEGFLMLESPPDLDLADSWKALNSSYHQALGEAGLDLTTEVFARLHVSDALNQNPMLQEKIALRGGGLVSVIGQSPLQRNKLALEAYHVKGREPCLRRRLPSGEFAVGHGRYEMIWGVFRPGIPGSSAAQTADLLQQLEAVAASHGCPLRDDLLRTWFFVRDIDNNYRGLVEARRDLFERYGMTKATHYVTSTGIAGELKRHDELVAMDALLERGLDPAQIRFMAAEDYLCPTHHYGVTFERGTSVTYGDRTHHFISGTASIDREGKILHEGDLDRQIERTLETIDALLANQGARLSDLKQAVVYLRDPSDGARARRVLGSLLPRSIPRILVEGRVCRPGWLVEIEGLAGTTAGDTRFGNYF